MKSAKILLFVSLFLSFLVQNVFSAQVIRKAEVSGANYVRCVGPRTKEKALVGGTNLKLDVLFDYFERNGFAVVVDPSIREQVLSDSLAIRVYAKPKQTFCDLARIIARKLDVTGKLTDDHFYISPYVKIYYTMPYPLGQISQQVLLNNQSSAGISNEGSTGGMSYGGSTLTYQATLELWKSLEKGMAVILGEGEKETTEGFNVPPATPTTNTAQTAGETPGLLVSGKYGVFWYEPATGMFYMKVRPSRYEEADSFVRRILRNAARVIKVKVIVYEVIDSDSLSTGANWRIALHNVIDNFNIGFTGDRIQSANFGGTPGTEGTLSDMESIYAPTIGGIGTIDGVLEKFFFSVLSKYTKVKLIDQATVLVSNGFMAEISRGRYREYVSSVTRDTSGDTGTVTSSVEKGSIMSGIKLSITGHIVDDEHSEAPPSIFLNIFSDVSRLESMETLNFGTETIQNPTFSAKRSFLSFVVPAGKPIALVSLDSTSNTENHDGIPGSGFFSRLFSFHQKEKGKETTVIILVPTIVEPWNVSEASFF